MKSKFESAIGSLNPQQLQAVTTTEGPVMVIAGPGTGKTHVLTLRIAEIINKGLANPSEILALTFTDAAAQNMRDRLIQLIDTAAYSVQIQTFHAFCNEVIVQNPEFFTFNDKSTVISELEQLQIIREILLDDATLEHVKPLGRFDRNVKSVATAISEAKREGISPEQYAAMVEAEWIDPETDVSELKKTQREEILTSIKSQAKLKEVGRVYSQYESRLSAAGRFDYDDLIMSVIDAFKANEQLLREYQVGLQYILVDEYQDTNTAQNEVVRLLASYWGEQANVFVVGDPHQSIYRFQGASLYNSTQFLTWYPTAAVITLIDGYRCPPEIYSLAHRLISQTTFLQHAADKLPAALLSALHTPLVSQQSSSAKAVTYMRLATRDAQLAYTAQEIKKHIDAGVSPTEIAVLFKKNADSDIVAQYLTALDIPYVTAADGDALQSQVVSQLLDYLRLLHTASKGNEPEDLAFRVFGFPWLTVDSLLLFKIGRLSGQTKKNLWDLVATLTEWDVNQPLTNTETAALLHLRKQQATIARLAAAESGYQITDWLRLVIQDSGLAEYVFAENRMKTDTESVIALQSFMAFVERSADSALQPWGLLDVLMSVETMSSQEMKVPLPAQIGRDAVTLSTVHKAKGMEWKYVFVIDLNNKKWGKTGVNPGQLPVPLGLIERLRLGEAAETKEERQQQRDDDDRRLLYVAMTRARTQLYLFSYLADTKFGRVKSHSESMFITETGVSQEEEIIGSQHQVMEEHVQRVALLAPPPHSQDSALEAYVASLIKKYHLTVTGLNSYLKDPREFLFTTLLRVPTVKTENQEVGTAMHSLLQKWTQTELQRSDGGVQKSLAQEVGRVVEESLRHHAMQDRWSTKAEQVALAYMNMTQHESYDLVLAREYSLGKGGRTAVLNTIMLAGTLDRLDWASSEKKAVVVIDYKTGRPKSKGDVLAQTEAGRKYMSQREHSLPTEIQGAYYRQLLFYKLLGELDTSMAAPITLGVLDFVEKPSRDNALGRVQFELPQAHVELLKELITEVMTEIRSLSFLTAALEKNQQLLPESTQEE